MVITSLRPSGSYIFIDLPKDVFPSISNDIVILASLDICILSESGNR